jgi:hypothetical protein
MKVKVLPPAMQHGEEADFHTQMLRIAGDGEQGFGSGGEQEVVDDLLVVESDGGDRLWECEDHMEVLGGQQLGGALLEPFFACRTLALWAMTVAAGTIADVSVLTVVAPFDRTAHRLRAAGFNGLHQAMLIQGQGMRLTVGRAVLSKDVGQLRSWPAHQRFGRLLLLGLSS